VLERTIRRRTRGLSREKIKREKKKRGGCKVDEFQKPGGEESDHSEAELETEKEKEKGHHWIRRGTEER